MQDITSVPPKDGGAVTGNLKGTLLLMTMLACPFYFLPSVFMPFTATLNGMETH